MSVANPAPHAAAPACPPAGSVGTITFHGPNGDVTKPYMTDLPHQAGCCCEKCRFSDPLKTQVGGDHYQKDYEIQPVEFIQRNDLGFIAGCIIKYVCRVDKGRLPKAKILQDIDKMIHYLQIWRKFLDKQV